MSFSEKRNIFIFRDFEGYWKPQGHTKPNILDSGATKLLKSNQGNYKYNFEIVVKERILRVGKLEKYVSRKNIEIGLIDS